MIHFIFSATYSDDTSIDSSGLNVSGDVFNEAANDASSDAVRGRLNSTSQGVPFHEYMNDTTPSKKER